VAVGGLEISRIARLAARAGSIDERQAAGLFSSKRVLVAVERLGLNERESLLLATNQLLRFCGSVSVSLPASIPEPVLPELQALAIRVRGGNGSALRTGDLADAKQFDAVLVVGSEVRDQPGWVAVSSDGWLARTASWTDGSGHLPSRSSQYNPIGAHVAASLGSGRVFLHLLGRAPGAAHELSAYALTAGSIGSQDAGPELPRRPLKLDAFIIGCGSVMQGWAYTIRRLPVRGRARAVDPEFLGVENLGPYVLAWRTDVGREKVRIIADALGPAIAVTPDRDFVEFLEMRIAAGLPVPSLVIAGLNDPAARHVVQRWWPDQMIDMATDGLNSQVIVKGRGDNGICLVEAIPVNPAVPSTLAQRAASAGLSIDTVLADPTGSISDADVGAADEAQRAGLRAAMNAGIARCSRILAQELDASADPDFAPAAPFVASFTGSLAAGLTMRRLSGEGEPLHVQRSFQSERTRRVAMRAGAECECQRRRAAGTSRPDHVPGVG
jgi:hypothetical protein